jgi:hypothetical protein
MKKAFSVCALLLVLAAASATPLHATGLSGAIFTTLSDGSEVNFNIYPSKPDVYLDGGPPVGAPAGAAGLPGPGSTVFGVTISGTYVFQVTDPPGKNLLSTDNAGCRQFTVDSNGVINGVTPAGACAHATSPNNNTQVGGVAVQLCALPIPGGCFLDTPNKGGEYKVWATPVEFYQCPLNQVSCGTGNFGFIPSYSKTDNFKVKLTPIQEFDVTFRDTNNNDAPIDGLFTTHVDTIGASNQKVSYYNPANDVNHIAHIESPEIGTHQIVIFDQPGCTVTNNYVWLCQGSPSSCTRLPNQGPQTIPITVKQTDSKINVTWFVYVDCN